jgi:hypothetical protein
MASQVKVPTIRSPHSLPNNRGNLSCNFESPAIAPGFRFLEVIMTQFTIETTYRLPVYRQRTYAAETLVEACRHAVEDDDWDDATKDYESSGSTYVSVAWEGAGSAYRGPALAVPGQFDELVQRKADQFELMLGMLKILSYADDLQAPDLPTWLPRTRALIAKAEAILAGEPDPDPDPAAAAGSVYIVRELPVSRVREQVVAIIETDPEVTPLSADAVTDMEIYHACSAVVADMNLEEQVGSAAFRAGFMAIRAAGRRLTCEDGGGPDNA